MRSAAVPHVRALAEQPATAARCCWIGTPYGSRSKDSACFVAGTPQCDSRRESGRCRAATHRACRPSAVPRFHDILLQRPRHRDRQSPTQGSGPCAAFACPVPFGSFDVESARRLRVASCRKLANECGQRSFARTTKCEAVDGWSRNLFDLADLLHRRDQARAVVGNTPLCSAIIMKRGLLIAGFVTALAGAILSYVYFHATVGVTEGCRRNSEGVEVCPPPYQP